MKGRYGLESETNMAICKNPVAKFSFGGPVWVARLVVIEQCKGWLAQLKVPGAGKYSHSLAGSKVRLTH